MTTAPGDALTRWTDLLLPRFRWGEILPRTSGVRRGEGYQFYRLVPLDVMLVSTGLGIEDYTPEGLPEPTKLVGVFHPSNTTLTIARSTESRIKAFGMEFHNSGKSAFSAPFRWSA